MAPPPRPGQVLNSIAPPHPPTPPGLAPGLIVAGAVAVVASVAPWALGLLPGVAGRIPLSPVFVAILVGLSLSGVARSRPAWLPGLEFAARRLLRLAVMLIGLRLSLGQVGQLGMYAVPMVVGALVSGLGLAWLLGRIFGVGERLTALIAVGSAICGASAIAATAPALRPRPEETAYALACVALFGLVAAICYPLVLAGWGVEGRVAGLVLGASIHDTAQVTAAALLFEQTFADPEVVAAATVTKLLRNVSMLVVIPMVAWWVLRGERAAGTRPPFPLFILGFLALAGVRGAGDAWVGNHAWWQQFLSIASLSSGFLFAMAMAAIGMGISLQALRTLGARPALVAILTAAGMASTALLLVAMLH